jgi:hypothetical protein
MQLETAFPIIGTPTPVRHRRDHDGLPAYQVRDVVRKHGTVDSSETVFALPAKTQGSLAKRRSSSANTSDAGMPGVSPES